MKIVFMGTPDFAVPAIEKLQASDHEIALVITQPDRPSGRGRKVTPSPVKEMAQKLGLEVYQPEDVNTADSVQKIRAAMPDVIVVIAFGQILRKNVLDMPALGCINVHASLLPKYRGAAPINRAIMDGETLTGITTMKMNAKLDEGDILLQAPVKIELHTTAGMLHDQLSILGADLILGTLNKLESAEITPKTQDAGKSTYAKKIASAERGIDWTKDAETIDRQIRGLSPSPGAYTFFGDKRLLILDSTSTEESPPDESPGAIIAIKSDGFEVSCGSGKVTVLKIQPEGKKAMEAADWCNGARIDEGERFTPKF